MSLDGASVCSLCEIKFDNIVYSVECGHIFHLSCLSERQKRLRICPQCILNKPAVSEITTKIDAKDFNALKTNFKSVTAEKQQLKAELNALENKLQKLEDERLELGMLNFESISTEKPESNDLLQQQILELTASNKDWQNKFAEINERCQQLEDKLNEKSLAMQETLQLVSNESSNNDDNTAVAVNIPQAAPLPLNIHAENCKILQQKLSLLTEELSKEIPDSNDLLQQQILELTASNKDWQNKFAEIIERCQQLEDKLNEKSLAMLKTLQLVSNESSNNDDNTAAAINIPLAAPSPLNIYAENCKILQQKLAHLTEELSKEIHNSMQLSIDKMKLQAYVEQMKKGEMLDSNSQLNKNTLTDQQLNGNFVPRNQHSKKNSVTNQQLNKIVATNDAELNGSQELHDASKDTTATATASSSLTSSTLHLANNNDKKVYICNYQHYEIAKPYVFNILKLSNLLSLNITENDIETINCSVQRDKTFRLTVEFKTMEIKDKFLQETKNLKQVNDAIIKKLQVKDYVVPGTCDLFKYANANLCVKGIGYASICIKNNKVLAKRYKQDKDFIEIRSKEQIDELKSMREQDMNQINELKPLKKYLPYRRSRH